MYVKWLLQKIRPFVIDSLEMEDKHHIPPPTWKTLHYMSRVLGYSQKNAADTHRVVQQTMLLMQYISLLNFWHKAENLLYVLVLPEGQTNLRFNHHERNVKRECSLILRQQRFITVPSGTACMKSLSVRNASAQQERLTKRPARPWLIKWTSERKVKLWRWEEKGRSLSCHRRC